MKTWFQSKISRDLLSYCIVGRTYCIIDHTYCIVDHTYYIIGHTYRIVGRTYYIISHTYCIVGHTYYIISRTYSRKLDIDPPDNNIQGNRYVVSGTKVKRLSVIMTP